MMTYAEINNKMAELAEKIHAAYTYYQFDVGSAPKPPYLVFYFPSTENFSADNIVYAVKCIMNIEYYSDKKDFDAEQAIEKFLQDNEIPWEKEQAYLDDENMWETLYNTTVFIEYEENEDF